MTGVGIIFYVCAISTLFTVMEFVFCMYELVVIWASIVVQYCIFNELVRSRRF